MHRNPTIELLERYESGDPQQGLLRQRFLEFIASTPLCLKRTNVEGHLTASAWVMDPDRHVTLLALHTKLNIWVQLGGHVESEDDLLQAALREVREESGLDARALKQTGIFDLDLHTIPQRKGVPQHLHYDVRFLLQADSRMPLKISDESNELRWIALDRLEELTQERSIQRMRDNYLALKNSGAL